MFGAFNFKPGITPSAASVTITGEVTVTQTYRITLRNGVLVENEWTQALRNDGYDIVNRVTGAVEK